MIQMDKRIIELAILALQTKQVSAWVDHYDAGEDGKLNLMLQNKEKCKPNVMQTFFRIQNVDFREFFELERHIYIKIIINYQYYNQCIS